MHSGGLRDTLCRDSGGTRLPKSSPKIIERFFLGILSANRLSVEWSLSVQKNTRESLESVFPKFFAQTGIWGIYWFPRKPLKSHSMTKNVICLEYITKITSIGPQQGLKLNSNGTQQSEFTYLIGTNKIIE